MKSKLPNLLPYAQPVVRAYAEIENLIVDCKDTLSAIDRSDRLKLPVVICTCCAPTVNGKRCTRCEREQTPKEIVA